MWTAVQFMWCSFSLTGHIYTEILKNIIYGIVVSALTEAEVLLSFLMIFYYYY